MQKMKVVQLELFPSMLQITSFQSHHAVAESNVVISVSHSPVVCSSILVASRLRSKKSTPGKQNLSPAK